MRRENKSLLPCFYAFFYCGIIIITVGSALPDIRSAHNLSASAGGALLSCYSLGNLSSGIISGLAVIYLGRKKAITLLALCACAGMSMLACGHVPAILFVGCALSGLGRGSMITFSQGIVNSIMGGNAKITGLLHATFAAGAIIAPLMFSALRVISWKAGIILVALLGVIAAVMFIMSDYPATEKGGKSGGSLSFFRDKGFIVISCLMFLYLCCEFALNGWLVSYMTYKNMPISYAHSMASLLWLIMLAGRLLCAKLSEYVSQGIILLVSAIGSAVSFALMLMAGGAVNIAVSVALTGLFMAGISPIIYGASAPYTNKYPLAMGMLFTFGCIGGTVMPLITGIIAEHCGFDGGMSAILVAFGMLIIFSVIQFRAKNS